MFFLRMITGRQRVVVALGLFALGGIICSCAYRLEAGPLEPLAESGQRFKDSQVLDDGTVVYRIKRLKISLKPMSDEELNRQFPHVSESGRASLNPYTFSNWKPEGTSRPPARFTVFLLEVENYAFPKVLLRPLQMRIQAQNGRVYRPYSFQMLREYYYPYNVGYAGNASARFEYRTDLFKRTMFPADDYVFSGNTQSGYVVFPPLHDDVNQIEVYLDQIALRFDYREEPTEARDLVFNFQREVRRVP